MTLIDLPAASSHRGGHTSHFDERPGHRYIHRRSRLLTSVAWRTRKCSRGRSSSFSSTLASPARESQREGTHVTEQRQQAREDEPERDFAKMSGQPLRCVAHEPDREDDPDQREETKHDQAPAKTPSVGRSRHAHAAVGRARPRCLLPAAWHVRDSPGVCHAVACQARRTPAAQVCMVRGQNWPPEDA
jgi:hypothetical protein